MNEKEFENIYIKYYQMLYYCALRLVSSNEIAEDIVQNVFADFWFHRAKIDKKGHVKSYLYTMVRNKSLDYLKSSGYKLSKVDCAIEEYLLPILSVDNEVHLKELKSEINFVVSRLPDKCKSVYTLSRVKGFKNEEIAKITGVDIKTVEKHITKVLSKIRQHLHKIGYLAIIFYTNL